MLPSVTVAAAAHARLAQSYNSTLHVCPMCSRVMPSRHAPTDSCDASMRLSPVTTRCSVAAAGRCVPTDPSRLNSRLGLGSRPFMGRTRAADMRVHTVLTMAAAAAGGVCLFGSQEL